jgi:hypothetical protein
LRAGSNYLRSTISEEQQREFGQLVEDTVNQIEAAQASAFPRTALPGRQSKFDSSPEVRIVVGRWFRHALILGLTKVKDGAVKDSDRSEVSKNTSG